jgi:hypothetical protein
MRARDPYRSDRWRLRAAAVLSLATLSSCAAREAYQAGTGRTAVLGFTKTEMVMCAGIPQRTWSAGEAEVWSYDLESKETGGVSITAPVFLPVAGVANIGGSAGYCHMQVRFRETKVTEVTYAGETDIGPARNAVCAPIVRGCLAYKARRR